MVRKLLIALALTLAPQAHAADAIRFGYDPAANLYVRIWTSATASSAFALTEGSSGALGRYVIADSAISGTISTAGVYNYKIFVGATPSTTANDVNVGLGTLYWTGTTAETEAQYLLRTTSSDTGANTWGRWIYWLGQSFASEGVFDAPSLANSPAPEVELTEEQIDDIAEQIGESVGTTQPRINREPDPAFTFQVSRRADGTYKCTRPLRLSPGSVETVHPFIDMSPLFGRNNFVETVGTPVVSGGSLTAQAEGPRDWYAAIQVDGTATASESRTITLPITMTSGAVVRVVLDVLVFGS